MGLTSSTGVIPGLVTGTHSLRIVPKRVIPIFRLPTNIHLSFGLQIFLQDINTGLDPPTEWSQSCPNFCVLDGT